MCILNSVKYTLTVYLGEKCKNETKKSDFYLYFFRLFRRKRDIERYNLFRTEKTHIACKILII